MGKKYNQKALDISLTEELLAGIDNIANVIGNSSPVAIGEHLEARLREKIIKRFLPKKFTCGSGHIAYKEEKSKQIDVLIWDSNNFAPIIADERTGYYVVHPESVRAIIEVKKNLSIGEFLKASKDMLNESLKIDKYIAVLNRERLTSIDTPDRYPPSLTAIFFYEGYKEYDEETFIDLFEKDFVENLFKLQYHYSSVIYFILGENILVKYHNNLCEAFLLPKRSMPVFLRILEAWLVEDRIFKLFSIDRDKKIITEEPIYRYHYMIKSSPPEKKTNK